MAVITDVINSRYLLWLALSVPSTPIIMDFWLPDLYYSEMMYNTGVLSVQLLLFTIAITPITRLLSHWHIGHTLRKWLLQRRRYFGVATFVYALLHLLLYIREEEELTVISQDALSIAFGSGWIAFFVLMVLAVTSNNFSVRRLGKRWHRLQRWIYIAIIAIFTHWLTLGIFLPLAYELILLCIAIKAVQVVFVLISKKTSFQKDKNT